MVVIFIVTNIMVCFLKVTCVKVLNFFMVTWITFLDHMCHFSWLQVPIFTIASVLFHGDMLSQNLQPTSQKGE
jgi:hypothetical protein